MGNDRIIMGKQKTITMTQARNFHNTLDAFQYGFLDNTIVVDQDGKKHEDNDRLLHAIKNKVAANKVIKKILGG